MNGFGPEALVPASSPTAAAALARLLRLQSRFADRLTAAARRLGVDATFEPVSWLRDGGVHGGGTRLEAPSGPTSPDSPFNRGSINVSQVHYDDLPGKRLSSATALSTIIHPRHPLAPSVHMHVSWTEMRDGVGYWRVMADLNPSLPRAEDTERFVAALRKSAPAQFERARAQGDAYFEIPALERHRGVAHFYLEGFRSDDPEADAALAEEVITAAIDTYVEIFEARLRDASPPTDDQLAAQLAYHTAYLFQVLTLDRGTTSGLLVHDQNDVGTMGSLPAFVDRSLLASWADRVPEVQAPLVRALADALPDRHPTPVNEPQKRELAAVARAHYRAHPEALEHQAPTPKAPAGRGHR